MSFWQNGCSEALIKAKKRSIIVSLGDNTLTFGEQQTAFFEVANLNNERPIGIKSGLIWTLEVTCVPMILLLEEQALKFPVERGLILLTQNTD